MSGAAPKLSAEKMRELLRAILQAFPTGYPPNQGQIVARFVGESETRELIQGLANRRWTEIESEFIQRHGDWLVYLTPIGFAYYLPAWMAYGLNYERAGYVADWTVSFFCHPPASEPMTDVQSRMIGALSSEQKSAVIRWITYVVEANPGADPGYLKKQGLDIEDAVYNLSLRPYDSSGFG